MPATCVAINCSEERSKDTAKRGITFHSFPKDPLRRKLWRAAVRRRTPDKKLWEPGKNSFLCSRHFKPETFDRTGQTVRLRDHAVPTEFNFTVKREKNEPHRKKKRPLDDWQQESQDHDYSLPSVEILAQKHRAAEQAVGEKEWQIKNMKEVEKGLKLCCVNAIDTLLEKKLISIHLREKLLSYGDIPLHLFEKPVKEFSLNQKSFVTTLLLYNPNAYEFLQKKMKLPLPDPEIIRTWLKSSDDSPGFNSCVINALAHNKKEKPDEYTHACLIIDTMALQQHISYNSCKKTMTGFVDLGNGSELQGEPANQVLVLMLVGIKGQWKAPIAYFFANQLTTEVKKALVWHALEELVQFGFEVVAITMDSHPTNVGMCKLLGCKFTVNQQLKTYFKLPDSDHKCYVIFDVSRELKLKRSDLEAYGTIKSQEGYVNWDYIKNLHNLQGNADLRTENTQSQEHIRASAEKIKVSLVAQPFSSSVAELLNMLHGLHVPQFEDCLATVSFIERMVMLSDVLNSRSTRYTGYLGPITTANLNYFLSFLLETREYLLSLKAVKTQNCIPRKMCVLGLVFSITSFSELVPKLLDLQECVLTYRFSLDHMEQFFNILGGSGNFNNLTAHQFRSAFRKLLIQCGIQSGLRAKVVAQDTVDFVGATGAFRVPPLQQQLPSLFSNTSLLLPDHNYTSAKLRSLVQNSEMYIGGWVVRKALECITCEECRCALVTKNIPVDFCSAYHLLQLKDHGGLLIPSDGAVKTVKAAECSLREVVSVHSGHHTISELELQNRVLSKIGNCNIFALGEHVIETECGIDNHHFNLIRMLVSIYHTLKRDHIAKLLRHKYAVHRVLAQTI